MLLKGEVCCGVLVYYMGKEEVFLENVWCNVDMWIVEVEGEGLDVVLIIVLGCGIIIKDYGYMLCEDFVYVEKVVKVFVLVKDIMEFLVDLDFGVLVV